MSVFPTAVPLEPFTPMCFSSTCSALCNLGSQQAVCIFFRDPGPNRPVNKRDLSAEENGELGAEVPFASYRQCCGYGRSFEAVRCCQQNHPTSSKLSTGSAVAAALANGRIAPGPADCFAGGSR